MRHTHRVFQRHLFSLAAFTGMLLLAAGCSSPPPENLPPPQPITFDPEEPQWVTRPWSVSQEGTEGVTLYAVGYAPHNDDLSLQLEIARSRARSELARIIGALVTAVTRDVRRTAQNAGGGSTATTDQFAVVQSELLTQELLEGSRQVDVWRDSKEGLWVLVKLPLAEALPLYRESLLGQLEKGGVPAQTLNRIQLSTEEVLNKLMAKGAEGVRTYLSGKLRERGTPRQPSLPETGT